MQITNKADIPLGLAVWLVADNYDYVNDPKYISATTLLKPVKQIILSQRVDQSKVSNDLEDYIARSMGTSLHSAIEAVWKDNPQKALKTLGYSDSFCERVKINPEEPRKEDINIFLEQRAVKKINGWSVGGKYDLVVNGLLNDYKSTSVYTYINNDKDKDYQLQGSIYRWLNPDKITEDWIQINFIFTDWSSVQASRDSKYPQHRIAYKQIPLLSIQDTENFIAKKLSVIDKYLNSPESEIPPCQDEDLWRSETKYKYFSNPESTRATKNFDSQAEANRYWMVEKKGKGIVKVFPGSPRRCMYCGAASICQQRKQMLGD